jgi:hypothetical protein
MLSDIFFFQFYIFLVKVIKGMLGGIRRGIAQPGSASGLGPEGRGFKSYCPDHLYNFSHSFNLMYVCFSEL